MLVGKEEDASIIHQLNEPDNLTRKGLIYLSSCFAV